MENVVSFLSRLFDIGIKLNESKPKASECEHKLPASGVPHISMGSNVAELCNFLQSSDASRKSAVSASTRENLYLICQSTRKWLLKCTSARSQVQPASKCHKKHPTNLKSRRAMIWQETPRAGVGNQQWAKVGVCIFKTSSLARRQTL